MNLRCLAIVGLLWTPLDLAAESKLLREEGIPMRHGAALRQLMLSPDARQLVTLCRAKKCFVWDVATGKRVREYPSPDGPPLIKLPVLSPDGAHLALPCADQVRIVETFSGKEIAKVKVKEAETVVLALAPGGKLLARYARAHSPHAPREGIEGTLLTN